MFRNKWVTGSCTLVYLGWLGYFLNDLYNKIFHVTKIFTVRKLTKWFFLGTTFAVELFIELKEMFWVYYWFLWSYIVMIKRVGPWLSLGLLHSWGNIVYLILVLRVLECFLFNLICLIRFFVFVVFVFKDRISGVYLLLFHSSWILACF